MPVVTKWQNYTEWIWLTDETFPPLRKPKNLLSHCKLYVLWDAVLSFLGKVILIHSRYMTRKVNMLEGPKSIGWTSPGERVTLRNLGICFTPNFLQICQCNFNMVNTIPFPIRCHSMPIFNILSSSIQKSENSVKNR